MGGALANVGTQENWRNLREIEEIRGIGEITGIGKEGLEWPLT
jgi:hypothetical protein